MCSPRRDERREDKTRHYMRKRDVRQKHSRLRTRRHDAQLDAEPLSDFEARRFNLFCVATPVKQWNLIETTKFRRGKTRANL